MSSLPLPHRPGGPPGRWPLARRAGLAALLPAEVLALSLAFDAGDLVNRGGVWADLVGRSTHVVAVGIAAAAAAALLQGPRLRERLRWAAGLARPGGRGASACLLGHVAALAGFAALTAVVFSGGLRSSPYPGALVAAWAAAGAATVALWLITLVPLPALPALARGAGGALLAGLGAGAAAWGAGRLTGALWRPLGGATLGVSYQLLRLACPDAYCRPGELALGAGGFEVEIAPHCSGYEGIGLIWVFLAVYLWAFRRDLRFPRVLLLVPAATALIWLANAARIAALVFLGARVSAPLAAGGFHSQAGWLALNAVSLGVVAASRRMRFFAADAGDARPGLDRAGDPTGHLAPLVVLLAGAMITGALTAGPFDLYYPARAVAVAAALWYFRADELAAGWSWSWPAFATGAGVFALWMALEPAAAGGGAVAEGLSRLPRAGALAWLAFRAVGSSVVVPLAEELAFRGFLTRRLIAADFRSVPPGRFTWPSFLVSSALFGAMHSRWLAGTAAGMLYAAAYYRRGRLTDAVLAHATTNALIAAYVLATSSWSLWA